MDIQNVSKNQGSYYMFNWVQCICSCMGHELFLVGQYHPYQ